MPNHKKKIINKKSKKRRKKDRGFEPTKHHIIPRSRGGTNEKSNIILKTRKQHIEYHRIFRNATPNEIYFLVLNFGDILKKEYPVSWRILFGHNVSNKDVLEILEKEWKIYVSKSSVHILRLRNMFSILRKYL